MKGEISGEREIMSLDLLIYAIIDQNGPTSIPSIHKQINNQLSMSEGPSKPIRLVQIQAVIGRKGDVFIESDGLVSLRPEREFLSMTAELGTCRSPWFKLKVDFVNKTFMLLELNLDSKNPFDFQPLQAGSTDEFKRAIYQLKIWDWKHCYERQEIVLDGICWSIALKTKVNIHKSKGLDLFPKEWPAFYQALTQLTGKKFC